MANSPHLRLSRWLPVAACLALCLCAGCVRRRLTVRTQPAGAQVFVDNQEIGTTPCSASFLYYGTREIKVVKEGFRTETIFQKVYAPWYQIPPLDFVTESVWPLEIRDERIVDVQMVPEEIVPQPVLLERAQALRNGSQVSYTGPPPTGPLPAMRPPPPAAGVPGQGLPGGQPLPYEPLPRPTTVP